MAVELIWMMASRGLRISGSSTVSTRTSCLPCHASARISAPLLQNDLRASVLLLFQIAPRPGGGRDLAGFHELLEAPEVAPRLDGGLSLEQLGDHLADEARRGIVENGDADHRAPSPGMAKIDPAAIGNIGALFGCPCNRLALAFLGDGGV